MRHIEPRHPDRVIENIRLVRQDCYTNFIHAEGSARLVCGGRINPQNVMSGRESLEQETSSPVRSRLLAVHLQRDVLKRPAAQLQYLPGESSNTGRRLQSWKLLPSGSPGGGFPTWTWNPVGTGAFGRLALCLK